MASEELHIPAALVGRLERAIFGHRTLILALFALGSALLAAVALYGLRIDTSFTKTLPVRHEYMRTYLDPKVTDFRGANRVLVALIARDGNMFTPQFFAALRKATDAIVVMDGIDRTRVQSIFTPNVRYLEVVEDGIEAGNVVPADFQPTPAGLAHVRENILKAGIVDRLVVAARVRRNRANPHPSHGMALLPVIPPGADTTAVLGHRGGVAARNAHS